MDIDATEKDLQWVRNELEFLSFGRMSWGLRPLEAMRYQELCELERHIIQEMAAA